MKQYHIGTAKQGNTLVIEARRSIDYLSCELYDYWGERVITKRQLRQNRYGILGFLKQNRPEVYGNLKYAIVN